MQEQKKKKSSYVMDKRQIYIHWRVYVDGK